jgi:hypothetical protein
MAERPIFFRTPNDRNGSKAVIHQVGAEQLIGLAVTPRLQFPGFDPLNASSRDCPAVQSQDGPVNSFRGGLSCIPTMAAELA